MLAHFARGSSSVDWCETNYAQTSVIAEFFNTISNVIFVVFPPFLVYLFRQYSQRIGPAVNIVWGLLVVIGLSSAYFHATLSLVGQLLDELAILWVLAAAFALWTPKWVLEEHNLLTREKFQVCMVVMAFFCTWLGFIYPVANAFVLMFAGVPFVGILFGEIRRSKNLKVKQLGYTCAVWWLIAVACWVSDRAFCSVWTHLSFPYLHCIWHVFIFIAAYIGCVLGAYFHAASEHAQLGPRLVYWPEWSSDWGIPYVSFHNFSKDVTA